MAKQSHVINIDGEYSFPRGFTISDNRVEDMLQRYLAPSEYAVWRQYLRFWGSNKKKAYPSLAYLSNVTGLSEKTIRKCNKELRKKKFLTYISGGPGRSNLYTYKSIEKIIKYYYGNENAKNIKLEEEVVPIREDNLDIKKIDETFKKLTDVESINVMMFISNFRDGYTERYGYPYELDEKDAKILVDKARDLFDADKYINLINAFFKTKNAYIEKSDRSIYFFFRPTVIKALISEYNESDKGRWEAQAEKLWNEIKPKLANDKPEYSKVEDWVRKNTRLGSANKRRDEHVVTILIKRVKEYLESNL
jgi:hypothetical protein